MKARLMMVLLSVVGMACGVGANEAVNDEAQTSQELQSPVQPAAICRISTAAGAVTSSCGGPNSLFPECTPEWKKQCLSAGGSVTVAPPAAAGDVQCVDNHVLFHACDAEFAKGCTDSGGRFVCTDISGGECYEGTCRLPR